MAVFGGFRLLEVPNAGKRLGERLGASSPAWHDGRHSEAVPTIPKGFEKQFSGFLRPLLHVKACSATHLTSEKPYLAIDWPKLLLRRGLSPASETTSTQSAAKPRRLLTKDERKAWLGLKATSHVNPRQESRN